LALDDHRDPRRPRLRPEQGLHRAACRASRPQGDPRAPARDRRDRAPLRRGTAEPARTSSGADGAGQPTSILPTCHYNMGGIPANYHCEAMTVKDGDPFAAVPGLMALGEAASVGVHGANRLGSNSLLELVVFGRSAANRVAEQMTPGQSHKDM